MDESGTAEMGRSPKRETPWLANPPKYVGPFRTNVKDFLTSFGNLKSPLRAR